MRKNIFTITILLLLAVNLLIPFASAFENTAKTPKASTGLLLPPVCFTRQMFSNNGDVSTDELLSSRNVKIEVRFRIVDFIESLFKKK